MPALSAGIHMYRRTGEALEVLLVHPGGPFWRNKDDGVWSIPKGEIEEGEDPAEAALREFMEELGSAPAQPLRPLGEIRQCGGKRVHAFIVEGDAGAIASNTFDMEWPPKSGRLQTFPRRSTARNGSICDLRTRKSSPVSYPFSIGLRNSSDDGGKSPPHSGARRAESLYRRLPVSSFQSFPLPS
jgi:predicted NUDIX family NTP pyrophosphohydrolase